MARRFRFFDDTQSAARYVDPIRESTTMRFEPYTPCQLQFAYCYRVYLRFRTHALSPQPRLIALTAEIAQTLVEPLGVHVLELTANATDCLALLSLRPLDPVAAAVSKLKGQVSKWLNATRGDQHERLLSRGYFASTAGNSTDGSVAAYLQSQGRHHGYDARWARSPVFVKSFVPSQGDEYRLQAAHSHCSLRLHCVFATWHRVGVFAHSLANAITESWLALAPRSGFVLHKVSFLPDHVHLAVHVHPSVQPAGLICLLMNEAQSVAEFVMRRMNVPPAVERLWQPTAYMGSFGNLASPQVAAYLRRWEAERPA